MKKILLVALVLSFSAAASPDARAQRQTRARQTSAQGRVVVANDFPGADLGAKINAADRQLGASAGEILVRGGGVITSQVIVGSGHTLRFSAGTYRLETEIPWEGAILLKSNATVTGSGWDTVIVEPPRVGWIVFQSHAAAKGKPYDSGGETDLSISNLQIKGANPAVDGGIRATVSLGNCHRCRAENLWLDGTGVLGIQAGGNPHANRSADTVTISKNKFTRVATQVIAVVNARNVVIDGNTIKDSGRLGVLGGTAIDLEPNEPGDTIANITITNNLIDSRGSGFLHGNGILVQNGAGARDFGPVLVKGNTIIGGNLTPNETGNVASGIYVAAGTRDVEIADNIVRRVSHSGIRLENSTRNYVHGNTLVSTGSGGNISFHIANTTDSQIVNNVVSIDPNSPAATGVIQETGTSARNSYRGNTNGKSPLTPILMGRRGN